MAVIGRCGCYELPQVVVELPEEPGGLAKGFRRGDVLGAILAPDALCAPERRDAAFARHPGTGRSYDQAIRSEPLRQCLGGGLKIVVGHSNHYQLRKAPAAAE